MKSFLTARAATVALAVFLTMRQAAAQSLARPIAGQGAEAKTLLAYANTRPAYWLADGLESLCPRQTRQFLMVVELFLDRLCVQVVDQGRGFVSAAVPGSEEEPTAGRDAWIIAPRADVATAAPAGPSTAAPANAPPIAIAQYDPATGNYVGPDGRVYTQADVAQEASKEQTWQDMLTPPPN